MRKPFLGGNWKCNGDHGMIKVLCGHLNQMKYPGIDIVVAPPSLYLPSVQGELKGQVQVAGQSVVEKNGAYTGEISPEMLVDVGVHWCLVGHSERRSLFSEKDADVTAKIKALQARNIGVIACFGETAQQREDEETKQVIQSQLRAIFAGVSSWAPNHIVLAYEPVWAIGTGKVATPEIAQSVHALVRSELAGLEGSDASQVRIIYGGSVKPGNAASLAAMADIDGFLVGGASLKGEDFSAIASSLQA